MLATIGTSVLVLLILGVVLWGLSAFPAIDPTLKQIVKVVAIVIASVWVLILLFGMFGIHVPK